MEQAYCNNINKMKINEECVENGDAYALIVQTELIISNFEVIVFV